MDINELISNAKLARSNSYSPYSKYSVGAALLTKSGKLYRGSNIENHGIMSICAERTAFVKAISEGDKDFESITIVGSPKGGELEECLPCGYCRQFMSEFVDKDFKVYTITKDNKLIEYTMEEVLPYSFKFEN